MTNPSGYEDITKYVVVNPNNPRVGHFIFDSPMVDAETKEYVKDDQGRIKIFRVVIWGTKGLTKEQVDDLIDAAVTKFTADIGSLSDSVASTVEQINGIDISITALSTRVSELQEQINSYDGLNIDISDTQPAEEDITNSSGILFPASNILQEVEMCDITGLQPATEERLGGIKVGNNLSITEEGVLSADIQDLQSTASLALSGAVLPYESGRAYSLGSLVIYSARLYQCVQDTSGSEEPSNMAYWAMVLNLANIGSMLLPVGSVMAFAGSGVLDNYLLCDGTAISRTTYSALFSVIGTTYGSGDGSSTFNLPDLSDRFIQGSAVSGTVMAAGLPNITGDQSFTMPHNGKSSGAFYNNGKNSNEGVYPDGTKITDAPAVGTTYGEKIYFDASGSSAIYGASTTVQPPALTMRYMIKYQ